MKTIAAMFFLLFALGGCASTGPSMEEALLIAHFQMLNELEPQQKLFQQRIQPGLTKEQVMQTVAEIGDLRPDGQPSNRSFEEVYGVTVEMWEYDYYSKIFVLTFKDGRLVRLTDKPGNTVF